MTVKRRRIQKAPTRAPKPAPNAPAPSDESADHALPPGAFSDKEASDDSKPLSDSQRFFITLAVVSLLVILTFAVLQSVR
jgi:hypothetical protein